MTTIIPFFVMACTTTYAPEQDDTPTNTNHTAPPRGDVTHGPFGADPTGSPSTPDLDAGPDLEDPSDTSQPGDDHDDGSDGTPPLREGPAPCALVDIFPLDFGASDLGKSYYRTIGVENCSEESELAIVDLWTEGSDGFDLALEGPERLQPAERATLLVTFTPTARGAHAATAFVQIAPFAAVPFEIPLSAEAVAPPCNLIRASAHTWNAPPTGEPSIELPFFAEVEINALPGEGIVAVMTWDTPADPDQSDSGLNAGSDIDTHLLHPRGSWNNSPWDCYWLNIQPNWGAPGRSDDDPSLWIDDTDGGGPEVIHLQHPEDLTYQLGAYYFSDHGFGPSFLTLLLYLDGEPALELGPVELEQTGIFWHAVAIDWTQREVIIVDELSEGIPD